jgi:hypothetical protein
MTLTDDQLRGTKYDASARALLEAGKMHRLLDMAYGMHACCCMGPQDGEPECPCRMSSAAAARYLSIAMTDPDATNP